MKITARLRYSLFATVVHMGLASSPTPKAFGVSPPPDGGYPGFNTAAGQKALFSLTSGVGNTAVGSFSLFSNTDGSFNTALGVGSLIFNAGDQSTGAGVDNTAVGAVALLSNITGSENTALGSRALFKNAEGFDNTAIGFNALLNNTSSDNTAVGAYALLSNTAGEFNTAIGGNALFYNNGDPTIGQASDNCAVGFDALFNNTTGSTNTAIGTAALFDNTIGTNNTASGASALDQNTSGSFNTADGNQALFYNIEGSSNTASGFSALEFNTTGSFNTAVGYNALGLSTGSNNTAVGYQAGVSVGTADNVICIGANVGGGDVSRTTWIGNVYGTTTVSGSTLPVIVSDGGQLGTISCSRRFKRDIKPMAQVSEAILALKPVTFRYKCDKTNTPQFGLIAEEVAEVNPDLVARDKDGKPYTVRYDQVNSMLLNEFLKEHKIVEEQQRTIAELKFTVAQRQKEFEAGAAKQQEQIQALSIGLQRVSAQLTVASRSRGTESGFEVSKSVKAQSQHGRCTTRVVLNNQ